MCHEETPPTLKRSYIDFLNNSFLETEQEVKEVHHSQRMVRLLQALALDLHRFCSPEYALTLDSFNSFVSDELMKNLQLYFTPYSTNPVLALSEEKKQLVTTLLDLACDVSERLAAKTAGSAQVVPAIRALVSVVNDRHIQISSMVLAKAELALSEKGVSSGTPPPPIFSVLFFFMLFMT